MTQYIAYAVGLDSEIRGGYELARGSAADVARAVDGYNGYRRVINIYLAEHPDACPVDQVVGGGGDSVERTRLGEECLARMGWDGFVWAIAITYAVHGPSTEAVTP